MRRVRGLVIFVALLCLSTCLVQCASYAACVRYYKAIYDKQGTCPGDSSVEYQKKAKDCEDKLSQCNSEDFVRASDTTECIEKQTTCQNSIEWGVRLLSCHSRLNGVSQQCAAAFAR